MDAGGTEGRQFLPCAAAVHVGMEAQLDLIQAQLDSMQTHDQTLRIMIQAQLAIVMQFYQISLTSHGRIN